jgi:hypothetical protein
MAQKKPRIVLPRAIAVWPKLNEVDVYQPLDKKGRPSGAEKRRYITYLRYDMATLEKVKQQLIDAAKKAYDVDDDVKLPIKKIKKSKDSAEKEEVLQLTSGEDKRPPLFDSRNKRIPASVKIGGGSELVIDATVNHYEGFGGGINLYINAVQVKKLVEGGEFKPSFEADDDGFAFSGEDTDETAKDHNEDGGEDAYAF